MYIFMTHKHGEGYEKLGLKRRVGLCDVILRRKEKAICSAMNYGQGRITRAEGYQVISFCAVSWGRKGPAGQGRWSRLRAQRCRLLCSESSTAFQ